MDLSQVRSERLRRAFANLSPAARADLENNPAFFLKSDPYFSKGRISVKTITAGGGNSTLSIPRGEITLFDYAKGESMTRAGFPSAAPYDKATSADTNLNSKSETNGAEYVFVDGLSVILLPRSEPEIVRRVTSELYFSMSVGGADDFLKFGNPTWLGGGGGIAGAALSRAVTPNLQDAFAQNPGFLSYGLPSVNDVKMLTDPFIWGPKGKADSSMTLRCTIARDITWTIPTTRAADLANNVAAFSAPAAQTDVSDVDGTFIEFLAVLHSVQIGPRSYLR